MELRQIRHFIAIVEERNFSRAARRVCISQPALSRSLRMLEAALHTRLIERGLRRSLPTPAGERFLPHARAILADCERAKSAAQHCDERFTQQVTVGIDAAVAGWLSGRIAARVSQELPEVQLCFHEGTQEDLAALLRAGRLPFALTTVSSDAVDPLVVSEALAPLHSVVIGLRDPGSTHLSHDHGRKQLPSRWVTLDGLDDHVSLHRHFRRLGLGNPCVTLTGSLARLRSLITEGGYTALIPAQLLHAELLAGALQILDVEIPQGARSVGILHLDDTPQLPLMHRIKTLVRECWTEVQTPVSANLIVHSPAAVRWPTTPRLLRAGS